LGALNNFKSPIPWAYLYQHMAEKITKKDLLRAMDDTLQQLNLLRSALEKDSSRKQEALENYKKQFNALVKPQKI